MSSVCRGCGKETTRTRARYDERNEFIGEICVQCRPEEFEAHHEAGYLRIVPGHEAFPKQYKLNSAGIYEMKDEAAQDLSDRWADGPTARAEDAKRANRRTEPLSPEEIERTTAWATTHLRRQSQPSVN